MWPSLIAKSKEGGADVIQTYVFWNAHEPVRNKVRFKSMAVAPLCFVPLQSVAVVQLPVLIMNKIYFTLLFFFLGQARVLA